MKAKKLILLSILFVVLLLFAIVAYRLLSQHYAPAADSPSTSDSRLLAPDFTVQDASGQEVRLSDYAGTPVVINFWATWCGPCKSELPAFDAAYREYGDEVQFMMINLTDGQRETVDVVQAFLEEGGYSFPVCYDTTQQAAGTYGVYSIPLTLFIDREGQLAQYQVGAMSKEMLYGYLDGLLD